jgi:hypothetical protein
MIALVATIMIFVDGLGHATYCCFALFLFGPSMSHEYLTSILGSLVMGQHMSNI